VYNTKETVKQLMYQQMGYLKEIKTEFQQSKSKKEKEDIATNLNGVIKILTENV